MQYTVPLALGDFAPVILSALGLLFLTRMLTRAGRNCGRLAFVAFALVTLGGALKAGWKLIVASTGADIAWMNNSSVPLMVSGLVCLAWALWCGWRALITPGRSTIPSGARVWSVPFIAAAAVFGYAAFAASQGDRRWVFILLSLLTIANLAAGLQLIARSLQLRAPAPALLFAFNLVAVFVLARLARVEQQWIEQGINTVSQGAFALAAWKLKQIFFGKR